MQWCAAVRFVLKVSEMAAGQVELKGFIRSIPDWPKKGILFRDITPLLADAEALSAAVEGLCRGFRGKRIARVAAIEARGFIFGAAAAARLGAGFVPIRKKGKLPFETRSITYDLEYGTDTLEIHSDAIKEGDEVLMIDDLLATGGTMEAACRLVESAGGVIAGISFLVELAGLKGRERLKDYDVKSVLVFE